MSSFVYLDSVGSFFNYEGWLFAAEDVDGKTVPDEYSKIHMTDSGLSVMFVDRLSESNKAELALKVAKDYATMLFNATENRR
jgi:hypothetical protein